MEKTTFIKHVSMTIGAAVLGMAPLAAVSQTTGGYSDQAIAVRVPGGLCDVEERYLASLSRKIMARSDYRGLINHMAENCPLQLVRMDLPTQTISETDRDNGDDRGRSLTDRTRGGGTPGGPGPGGEGPGGNGPGGEGPGGEGPGGEGPGGEGPGSEGPGGEGPGGEGPGGEGPGGEGPGGEGPGGEGPGGEGSEGEGSGGEDSPQ